MQGEIPDGTVLDEKYRILSKLGEGGFGRVYLAEDLLLQNRHVAIKILTIEDTEREQYLIREMQFLADLNFPGIVSFYHHFRKEGCLFFVMEFCGGGSLWDLMRRDRPVETGKSIDWAIELCRILQLVHEKGVVHHDLKPENILFTESGVLKIGDFGIANTRKGTLPFMAPELFMPTERVSRRDKRIDIYALGFTLLELVTETAPFFGLSDEEILNSKVRLDFVSDSISSWIREIVLKALHPKPELRFQTMQEFKEALESRHVPYVFGEKRILAHQAASKAEWHLKRKKWAVATRMAKQAIFQDRHCVNALVTAGRCQLFHRRIEEASRYFEKAVRINPRVDIQKELGWIYLEKKLYPEAISMLNDYLQRNAADYEAYNLLAKAFYLTGRYEAASDLINVISKAYKDNGCFRNNLLICHFLLGCELLENIDRLEVRNPFIEYNRTVFEEEPRSWDERGRVSLKSKLIFQEFRFETPKKQKRNELLIETEEGRKKKFVRPLITIGRLEANDIVLPDQNVSRRHCVLVNYADDVWLYDLGSTHGTFCDGSPVRTSVQIRGRHQVGIEDWKFSVISEEGLLL